MAYHPTIEFFVTGDPTGYSKVFQAELDCEVNQMDWLLEEHEHINEEIAKKVGVAKADLINKYNIEEI